MGHLGVKFSYHYAFLLQVVAALWLFSIVGSLFSFITLAYVGMMIFLHIISHLLVLTAYYLLLVKSRTFVLISIVCYIGLMINAIITDLMLHTSTVSNSSIFLVMSPTREITRTTTTTLYWSFHQHLGTSWLSNLTVLTLWPD